MRVDVVRSVVIEPGDEIESWTALVAYQRCRR